MKLRSALTLGFALVLLLPASALAADPQTSPEPPPTCADDGSSCASPEPCPPDGRECQSGPIEPTPEQPPVCRTDEDCATFECPPAAEVCAVVVLSARNFYVTAITHDGQSTKLEAKLWFAAGNLGASAGCNMLSAKATFEDDVLTITGDFVTTLMACDSPAGDNETLLFEALGHGPFRYDGSSFAGADGYSLAAAEVTDSPAPPDDPGPRPGPDDPVVVEPDPVDFDLEQCRAFVDEETWNNAFGRPTDEGSGQGSDGKTPYETAAPPPNYIEPGPPESIIPVDPAIDPNAGAEPSAQPLAAGGAPAPAPTPSIEYCLELLSRIRTFSSGPVGGAPGSAAPEVDKGAQPPVAAQDAAQAPLNSNGTLLALVALVGILALVVLVLRHVRTSARP